MTTLMLAMGIYILGVAAVLYFRPNLMFFAETGAWKEFGLDSARTIMPFWMFALVWAVVSYASATLITVYLSGLALHNVPADVIEANISAVMKPVSKSPPPVLPTSVLESSSKAVAAAPSSALPGYYVLETPKSGPPKYIYFGAEPPSVENVARFSPA